MKRTTWLLSAILLLATVLRFYRVAEISLRGDEAANVFLAAQAPDAITRLFVAEDPHLPLFFWLLHFWMLVAGRSELAVRCPTILAGIVIVALVYAFGRRLFPKRESIALIGAFLAAINPYLIWDAQDAYMYSFLTAITLVSSIAFVRVMQGNEQRRGWLSYVMANALGLFIHYLAGLVLIAQGALWLWWSVTRRISTRRSIEWLGAQIATALLFLPWLVLVFPLLANFNLNFFPPANLFEMLGRALVAFTVGRADPRLMPPMVDPLIGGALALGFLVLFGLGFASFKPARPSSADARIVLSINLAVPVVALFLFSIWRFPIFDERYMLFLIPAFLLMVARGIDVLRKSMRMTLAPAIAIVFVWFASGYSLNNYFHVPAFAKSPDWRGLMQRLVAESQPGDALIQNYPDPALPYYLQERMPRVLLPRASSTTAAQVAADLNRLSDKFNRLWVQPAPFAEWDTDGLVSTWLNRHARPVTAYEFRGVNLALYLPGSIALHQARSIDATFANRVRLLAFDADAALKPGAPARLTLYWKSLGRAERDATVFVHLYDDSGALWSQQDHQPVNGTYPISQWDADTIVVDSYVLPIPADAPAGRYSLMVGMYDTETQTRQSVVNARGQKFVDDRVMLTGLEVRR